MNKELLIKFMHSCDFHWITDIAMINGYEMVCSKTQDGRDWWRSINVEGSGFEQLFKGSIKKVMNGDKVE